MEGGFMNHFALWVAALLTLGIVSFLYRDNPWYKVCEAIFVGISAGYWFVTYVWDNLVGKFWEGIFPPAGAERSPDWFMLLFGGFLGLLMLMRLFPKIGWVSRWPLAFIVGATAGLYLVTYFASNVMVQIEDTLRPLLGENYDASFADVVGNTVVFIGTFSGLVYFFFSKEHTGAFGKTARVGIFFLMVTFGASFGYTVMSRMSLLIGRLDFLFSDWLGLIQ